MIAKQDADQEQIQKANNAVDLLKAGIIEAMDELFAGCEPTPPPG
jgi:uncharacterized protein YvpB